MLTRHDTIRWIPLIRSRRSSSAWTNRGSKAAYQEGVELLDDAIAEDPHYAPALAWCSYVETMLSEVPGGVGDTPMAEALPLIKEYADRALAEDPACRRSTPRGVNARLPAL